MANTNAPFGLRPVRYLNGTPWNGQLRPYYCAGDYATALYIGDPVVHVGNANAAELMGFPAGTLSQIEAVADGDSNDITGVICGFLPTNRDHNLLYRPASTERIALVCDDHNVIFEIQDDGTATPTVDAFVGHNGVLAVGSGGSTTTGLSGYGLDAGGGTAPTTTATFQLHILGLSRKQGIEIGAYAVWEVLLNQSSLGARAALGIA